VADPENKFAELCSFIGIPPSDKPFDFYKKSEEVLKIYPTELIRKYHSSLLKKINTSRTGLWKKELSVSELKVADACAGRYAGLTGHEKLYPNPGFAASVRSIPGKCFAQLLYLATWTIDAFPYRIRMGILSKAPLVVGRLYLSIFNRKKLRDIDDRMKHKSEPADKFKSGWKVAGQ
jgi:hypothetical protein